MGKWTDFAVFITAIAGMCAGAYFFNQCSSKKSKIKPNYEEVVPVEESKALPSELEISLSSVTDVKKANSYKTLEDF